MKNKVISIITIASIILLPMWGTWGGFFGGDYPYHFWDMFKDGEYFLKTFPSKLYDYSFIPAIVLLISAFKHKRGLTIVSSVCGIVGIGIVLIKIMDQNDSSAVFDAKESSVAFGTWVVLVCFVLNIVFAIRGTDASKAYTGARSKQSSWECICGTLNSDSSLFCISCGKKRVIKQPTDGSWICSCGEHNMIGARFCVRCGKAMASRPLGAAGSHAPKDSWVCTCGKRNPNSAEKCLNCGKENNQNNWQCHCGNWNKPDAKYCRKCGERRPTVRVKTEKSTATTWTCKKCGKINPNSIRVCKDCGYEK